MKTLFLGVILSVCFAVGQLSAQNCSSSTIPVIDTTLNLSEGKFYPLWYSVPCVVVGQPYTQVIHAKNYSNYQGNQVDSVSIDSITNLPCGLCWTSSEPNNMVLGGRQFAIKISGTSNDVTESSYLMKVYLSAWVNGNSFPYHLQSNDSTLFVFYLRTADYWGNCAVPFEGANNVACSGTIYYVNDTCHLPYPTLSVTGLAGDCVDSTATLSVTNVDPGQVYQWDIKDEWGLPSNAFAPGSSVSISSFGTYMLSSNDPNNDYCSFYEEIDVTPAGVVYPTYACYEYTDTNTGYLHMVLAKDPANAHVIKEYLLFKTNEISGFSTYYQTRYRLDSLVGRISADSLGEFIDSTGYVLTNSALADYNNPEYDYFHTFYTIGFTTVCGADTFFNGPYADYAAVKPSHLDTLRNSDNKMELKVTFPGKAVFIGYVERQVGSGSFQVIDSVYAFGDTSIYIDNTIYGLVSYRIRFEIYPICAPQRSGGLVDVYTNIVTFFSTNGTPTTGITHVARKNDLALVYSSDGNRINATLSMETAGNVQMQIQDLSGRAVVPQDWGNLSAGSNTRSIDMSSLAESTYILCIYAGGQRECRKIVKF